MYGTLRLRGRIDHLLGLHLHGPVESVPPTLLRILRLGTYQLSEMGSVPGYAAVSESVDLAHRAGGKKGAGLVNAVLRAMDREGTGPDRFPLFDDDPVEHLATWGSHPRWLVESWVARFGPETTRSIVQAGNQVPNLFFRPIGISAVEADRRLRVAGIASEPGPAGSSTLRLPRGADPRVALDAAPGIIQDPAAGAVVDFVAPEEGQRVADLCAAPGGKGVGMMGLGAHVVASDVSPVRLVRMRDTLRRLDLPEQLVVARAESPPFRGVDVVLVDAPCTGTGTLARHPDAKWRLRPDGPAEMARIQAKLLAGAAAAVRAGGRLVYSTCTLQEEENEGTVHRFLSENPGFEPEGDPAFLQVLPDASRSDGAFAARMRKVA